MRANIEGKERALFPIPLPKSYVLLRDNANRRIPVSHKYPPGDWTRVPHDGKQTGGPLDQWKLCIVYECSETAVSPQGSPWQPTMLVVKPEGGPPASVKPGQKSCVRSSGIITLLAQWPSDGSGPSLPQTRPQWSITLGSPMYRDNANRRILVSHKYPPGDWTRVSHDGKQMGGPLDQWNCIWMQ
jgi:hypothetical protein